jgi:hypothetical protein
VDFHPTGLPPRDWAARGRKKVRYHQDTLVLLLCAFMATTAGLGLGAALATIHWEQL